MEIKKNELKNESETMKNQLKIEYEEAVDKIRSENNILKQEKETCQAKWESNNWVRLIIKFLILFWKFFISYAFHV